MNTAEPVWSDLEKRWRLDVMREGKRKVFTSGIPKRAGKLEVKRKYDAWLEGHSDKFDWRLNKCWPLYLADVESRTGHSESYIQREKCGRLYILPKVGLKIISKISAQDWQQVINGATGVRVKNLAHKTRANLRSTITDFCNFAVKSDMMASVPTNIYIPKMAPVIGKEILQPEQLILVFSTPCDAWYRQAWLLMAVTGLRPGEVYGLRNVDIINGCLTINYAINRLKEVTKGKNKRARRQMYLPGIALHILSLQRTMLAENGVDSPWVFPHIDGEQANPNVSFNQWKAFSKPLGIDVPLYSFRHTFISITRNSMPESMVKQLVGHGQNMDTFGVYGHQVNGELQIVQQSLNAALQKWIPDSLLDMKESSHEA